MSRVIIADAAVAVAVADGVGLAGAVGVAATGVCVVARSVVGKAVVVETVGAGEATCDGEAVGVAAVADGVGDVAGAGSGAGDTAGGADGDGTGDAAPFVGVAVGGDVGAGLLAGDATGLAVVGVAPLAVADACIGAALGVADPGVAAAVWARGPAPHAIPTMSSVATNRRNPAERRWNRVTFGCFSPRRPVTLFLVLLAKTASAPILTRDPRIRYGKQRDLSSNCEKSVRTRVGG